MFKIATSVYFFAFNYLFIYFKKNINISEILKKFLVGTGVRELA